MKWYRMQAKKNIPYSLRDYGIDYVCETANLTDLGTLMETLMEEIPWKSSQERHQTYQNTLILYSMNGSRIRTTLDQEYQKSVDGWVCPTKLAS